MVWPAIAAGAAVIGAASDLIGSRKASAAAKKAGKLNYENIMAETSESIRRAELQQEQAYGSAVAGIGGAGVRGGGTPSNYLDAMQTEFTRQNVWQQEAGQRRANIAKQTGQDIGQQHMNQGTANLFNSASNYFTNNWWNTANTTGGTP